MDKFHVFPEKAITGNGPVSQAFLGLGIQSFLDACRYVHALPYGYNSDRDEGHRNGKTRPIDDFLYTDRVAATISAKDEYLIYRKALSKVILKRPELQGVDLKRILHAREEGLKLLKANIQQP